ncbi:MULTISPECIES: hypothetical protein [unclassified Tolypothrix]|nr:MULTISPECIES: hypothetical protein [unclassified Tolypothrix]
MGTGDSKLVGCVVAQRNAPHCNPTPPKPLGALAYGITHRTGR